MIAFILLFPVFEVVFSIWATRFIGLGEALLLLAVAFFLGLSLMRAVGLNFPLRFQQEIVRGQSGGRTVVRGAFRFLAAALLIFPGFLSDIFAAFFLILSFLPKIERLAALWFAKMFRSRVIFTSARGGSAPAGDFKDFQDIEDFGHRPIRDVTPKKADALPKKDDQF